MFFPRFSVMRSSPRPCTPGRLGRRRDFPLIAKSRGHRYGFNMILEKFPEVSRLTASEKLIFVSELWNDLEAHPLEVPVSREVIAELDRRMDRFCEHPENFTTWEAVKERVLGPVR